MGSHLARISATRIASARVVALADIDTERACELAAQLGDLRTYEAPEDLIADSGVDAVIMTTPPVSHAELICACAEAGKHVFCEKPVVVDMEQARAVTHATRRADVQVQVGFNRRYDPAYLAAHDAIAKGDIGTPLVFRSVTRDRLFPPESYLESPGSPGMLVDTGAHDFDLARWLMGDEVMRLQTVAAGEAHVSAGHTAAAVNLVFRHGAIGNVEMIWGVGYADDVRTEIVGSEGTLAIGTASRLPVRLMTARGLAEKGYADHFDRFSISYRNELCAFVDQLKKGAAVRPTLDDGVLALQIALAAKESAENGMAAIDV